MNQSHRISRVASDFSIERILSEDSDKKSRESVNKISNEGSPCIVDERQYGPDNSSQLESVVPKLNSRSRLRFTDEERANYCDSRFLPVYSEISRSTDTAALQNLTSSREQLSSYRDSRDTKSFKIERNELSWLQCTRYRPPKLPRKSSNGKTGKRRPGAHPRIPFTTIQLQILEDKYRTTAYLSRRDVLQLSTTLRLPQSRVKIWFQNRRARDRRETGISGSNITILSDDQSLIHKSLSPSIENAQSSTKPL